MLVEMDTQVNLPINKVKIYQLGDPHQICVDASYGWSSQLNFSPTDNSSWNRHPIFKPISFIEQNKFHDM